MKTVSPDVSDPLALPVPPAEDGDDFEIYQLSDAEKAEIEKEVRAKLVKERRTKARDAAIKDEIARQRRQAGEVPADEALKAYNNEMVGVYIQMQGLKKPPGIGGRHEPDPIVLDGMVYLPGRHYNVKRAVAVYIVDLMDKARRHLNMAEGESRTYYQQSLGTMIYQGGIAQGGGSVGPGFDVYHKRPANG